MAKGPFVGPNSLGTSSILTAQPTWIKFSKTHTDLQAAATTNNIELYSMPAGGVISGVKVKHSVQFAGTGITQYDVSLGIAGTLEQFAPKFTVSVAVGNTAFQIVNTVDSENHGAVVSVRLAAYSTGANLSASTAGTVEIWLLLSKAVS